MANSSKVVKIPSFILIIIFLTIALSLAALIFAINALGSEQEVTAGYLLLIGFLGVALSTYVLLQMRRRISRLKIKTPLVTTMVECKKCGVKIARLFQRGDFIFKEGDLCQKCNDKMMITAIFSEKQKE